jgi:hypothetical protein
MCADERLVGGRQRWLLGGTRHWKIVALIAAPTRLLTARGGTTERGPRKRLGSERPHTNGLGEAIPLSLGDVQQVVAVYGERAAEAQKGLELTAGLDADQTTATVTATREVRLPFSGWLGIGSVTVTAVAHARAPLVAP